MPVEGIRCKHTLIIKNLITFYFFGCGGFEFEQRWLGLALYVLRFGLTELALVEKTACRRFAFQGN